MAEEIARGVGLFLSTLVVTVFKIIKGFVIGVVQGISRGGSHGQVL